MAHHTYIYISGVSRGVSCLGTRTPPRRQNPGAVVRQPELSKALCLRLQSRAPSRPRRTDPGPNSLIDQSPPQLTHEGRTQNLPRAAAYILLPAGRLYSAPRAAAYFLLPARPLIFCSPRGPLLWAVESIKAVKTHATASKRSLLGHFRQWGAGALAAGRVVMVLARQHRLRASAGRRW